MKRSSKAGRDARRECSAGAKARGAAVQTPAQPKKPVPYDEPEQDGRGGRRKLTQQSQDIICTGIKLARKSNGRRRRRLGMSCATCQDEGARGRPCAACNPLIREHMERPGGGRNLGLDLVEGVHVLIEPRDASAQESARSLAAASLDAASEREANFKAVAVARVECEVLRERLNKALARVAELVAANDAAVTGRRLFFGPVLLKPARPGEWAGKVWLLDQRIERSVDRVEDLARAVAERSARGGEKP